jgi:hypothetical protein
VPSESPPSQSGPAFLLPLEYLALTGRSKAFKIGHVQTKVWYLELAVSPRFQVGHMHIIALVNGYVAAVGLAEQLRLVQCAAQCRDGNVLIVEAETRGVDLDVLVTTSFVLFMS